jgi:EmrB/QacA subfamily drug resistance transporter
MVGAVATQPAQLSRSRTNVIFLTILLGMLLAALDQTIVATALPTIVADLGGGDHMAWVVTAYLLAETVATVLVGKFGDLFGRKIVFQLSAVVFVGGSAFAGLAGNMPMLIAARAVQGVGGGGLMVTAMALIADVIPLRERGRYQGALGAVFGVTTVVGPTLGGLFTDHLSWRWCFYVNLPVAVVMLVMAARFIPSVRTALRPVIDYAGIVLVAVASCALVLALEWGGNQYAWKSPEIIGLFVGSAVLFVAFVLVELRAREPTLPMHLFRNPVFTVCSILSFIVGFAMLGAMTYLPTYLQFVDGVSATLSGLRTLPMVAGLLVTSMLSGTVIGRTGRYKVFPIVGTALMAVGLYLMSTMNHATGVLLESLYMLVLGLGIGLAMQVLTIAVQNTVPYAELGTATSGVTFFRTLGSSFGTAIFGTLYANKLTPSLGAALARLGVPAQAVASPKALHRLPAEAVSTLVGVYADALNYVFRWVVPVALVGFVVAWFLKEVPLRDSARANATDLGEGFAAPDSADLDCRLERALSRVVSRTGDEAVLGILEASGTGLARADAWLLTRVHLYRRAREQARISDIAAYHRVPPDVLRPAFERTEATGHVVLDGDVVTFTPAGQAEMDRLAAAWRDWLAGQLDGWDLTDAAEKERLDRAVTSIVTRLLDSERPWREPAPA